MQRDDRRFDEVDRTPDPAAFARWLDQVSADPQVRAYKRYSFDVLHLRPGARVLDVGCGTGDDVLALAVLVGEHGRVVGVDNSSTMVAEARDKAGTAHPNVEFAVGDVYALDAADESFDATRADRVLHHLDEPLRALREVVRVTRRGGRVSVSLSDTDTVSLAASDRVVTRKLVHAASDRRRNPWIAREMIGMFKDAGLPDPEPYPFVLVHTSLAVYADLAGGMPGLARSFQGLGQSIEDGIVTAEAGEAWWADLKRRDAEGRFYMVVLGHTFAATKP